MECKFIKGIASEKVMFNGQMGASENVLCQCLYTRNILPDQLLKMRSLEILGIGSDSRTCRE